MAQRVINANASAMIHSLYPSQSFYLPYDSESVISERQALLFAFPTESFEKKRVTYAELSVCLVWETQGSEVINVSFGIADLTGTFDPRTVNWNNAPMSFNSLGTVEYCFPPARAELNERRTVVIPVTMLPNILSRGIRLSPASMHEQFAYQAAFGNSNGSEPPRVTVTYFDAVPYAANCTPNGVTVRSDREQTFSWSFAYDHEGVQAELHQTAAKLRYRRIDEDVYNYADVSGSASSYTFPAGTFTAGKFIEWGVQVTSDDGVTGSWSSAVFEVSGAPVGLEITDVTSDPRSTVSWTAEGQLAYEVSYTRNGLNVCSSGAIYGADTTHTVSEYLESGLHQVFVRVRNDFGWSEWACSEVTIVNASLPQITLGGSMTADGAALAWDGAPDFTEYHVLRDGVPISAETGRAYTDPYCWKTHSYRIRGVDDLGNYARSNTLRLNAAPKHPMLIDVLTGERFVLGWRKGGKPTRSRSMTGVSEARYFEGRKLPVYETAGHVEAAREWSFTPFDKGDKVFELVNRLCFYRGTDGGCFVFVTGVSSDSEGSYSISAKEADCNERIEL